MASIGRQRGKGKSKKKKAENQNKIYKNPTVSEKVQQLLWNCNGYFCKNKYSAKNILQNTAHDKPPRGKRVVICHADSSKGFVNAALFLCGKYLSESYVDYHQGMNGKVFEDWF